MSEDKPVFFMKAYLWARGENWSEEQINELTDRFAEFLIENGFDTQRGDEPINSMIIAGQEYRPNDAPEFFASVMDGDEDITFILIPSSTRPYRQKC